MDCLDERVENIKGIYLMTHIIGISFLIIALSFCNWVHRQDLHTTAELEDAILTAYELGKAECPQEQWCMKDDVGMLRLTMDDVEEALR